MKTLLSFLLLTLVAYGGVYGQTVTTIASNVGVDDDLILTPEGDLIGAHYIGSTLKKVTLDGESTVFAGGFSAPNGLAYNSEGVLYMADNTGNHVYLMDENGAFLDTVDLVNPSGVLKEWDSDTIIVTTYAGHKIYKLAPDNSLTEFASDPEFNGPVGLCYDDNNQLYAANFGNQKIFRLDEDGNATLFTDISTSGAIGFIDYRNGYIYATMFQQAEIWRVDMEGNDELWLGSVTGSTDGDASVARFNRPNGIALSVTGDTMFISDFGSKSIRMITNLDAVPSNSRDLTLAVNTTLEVAPNPVAEKITITLDLPEKLKASLVLLNAEGKLLTTVMPVQEMMEGEHSIDYTLPALSPGMYYLSLYFNGKSQTNVTTPFVKQ